jgi:L-cystine uptake protein TcyP (sodium:dicarboxylate symporter family)
MNGVLSFVLLCKGKLQTVDFSRNIELADFVLTFTCNPVIVNGQHPIYPVFLAIFLVMAYPSFCLAHFFIFCVFGIIIVTSP